MMMTKKLGRLFLLVASVIAIDCDAATAQATPSVVAVTVSPNVTSIASNGSTQFTASVTGLSGTAAVGAGDVASQLRVLSEKGLLFGHQSVGGQLIAAINDLLAANAGPEPRMVANARSASAVGTGIWGEFGVGANAYPAGKIDDFVAVMNAGAGAKVNIAFMKYCYLDFFDSTSYWATGNVNTLFAKYKSAMAALRTAHPGATIVHFTVPLFTSTETNARREAYSNLVRSTYAGSEPVFDIAIIESTRANGTRCLDGTGVPALCPEYTTDGGHLNAAGKGLAARALVRFLAALP